MSEKLCVLTEQEVLEEQFTIYGTFDKPLFLAKDVAAVIEHSSITMMLKNVDEDEKVKIRPKESLGLLTSNNEYWFLTEDGLYEVLMQSRKPIAKEFKKQIKKILKGLRKGEIKMSDNTLNTSDMATVMQSMVDSNNNIAECMKQVTQMMGVMTQILQNNVTPTNTDTTPQTETQLDQDYITSCIGPVTGEFFKITNIAKDINRDLGICCSVKKLNKFLCNKGVITKVKGYEYKDHIYSNFYIITEDYRDTYSTILTREHNSRNGEFYLANVYRGNFRHFVITLVKNNVKEFLNS